MKKLKTMMSDLMEKLQKSFIKYPISIISVFLMSFIALYIISSDLDYNSKLHTTLMMIQYSLLVNTAVSMLLVMYSLTSKNNISLIKIIGTIITPTAVYFYLKYFGLSDNDILYSHVIYRLLVVVFISIIAYIILLAKFKYINKFQNSFYLFNIAFFSATFYGIVLLIGFYSVLSAFQVLVYNDMSYKIYSYLAIVITFLTYLIFLAYIPVDSDQEIDFKRSKFVYNVLNKVIVVIVLAMGFVLLVWALRLLVFKEDFEFITLSSIINSFTLVGMWLYIMIYDDDSSLSKFYKLAYKLISILILIIQVFAFVDHYKIYGLTNTNYGFILVSTFSLISILLLIIIKKDGALNVGYVSMLILLISALPIIGVYDLSVNQQIKRLKNNLVKNNMLINDVIIPNSKIDDLDKFIISNSFDYLVNSQKPLNLSWININDSKNDFVNVFGFERKFSISDDYIDSKYVHLILQQGVFNISNYDYYLQTYGEQVDFILNDKNYSFMISDDYDVVLKVNNELVLESSLNDFLDELEAKYLSYNNEVFVDINVMSIEFSTEEFDLFIVFDSIDFYSYDNKTERYISLSRVFINQK